MGEKLDVFVVTETLLKEKMCSGKVRAFSEVLSTDGNHESRDVVEGNVNAEVVENITGGL